MILSNAGDYVSFRGNFGVIVAKMWPISLIVFFYGGFRFLSTPRFAPTLFLVSTLKIEREPAGVGYSSLRDAKKKNNNVHDSYRLQNHTPRNPFRHLKQQRKHHSI